MGMLVDGEWLADDERHRRSNDGAFVRPASAFRGFVTADRSSGFPAEDRRYHLYAALSCPWAHRALIMRALAKTGGRRIDAANLLGMGRNTITRKIQELGIEDREKPIPPEPD